jgi:hypothetical protein
MEKNKDIPVKELLIDDECGVDAIALVEMPAIEIDFLLFTSKQLNVTLAKVDKEKKIVCGPAMIPDKMIYRYNQETNEEFYVYFKKETIEKIAQKYLIEEKQSNVNLEHELPLQNISLVESWIVIDPEKDKASALGYVVPEGTWMISMKINDDKIWNDMIKSEVVKGFSIEGFFVEKFAKHIDVTDEEVLQKIKELIEKIDE